jgi:hypothetical protein
MCRGSVQTRSGPSRSWLGACRWNGLELVDPHKDARIGDGVSVGPVAGAQADGELAYQDAVPGAEMDGDGVLCAVTSDYLEVLCVLLIQGAPYMY